MATTSQKEAADKSNQNFIVRIANRIPGAFVDFMPGLTLALQKNAEKILDFMSKNNWVTLMDSLVQKGHCDQDTANELKKVADYMFPWKQIMMFKGLLQIYLEPLVGITQFAHTLIKSVVVNDAPEKLSPQSALINSAIIRQNNIIYL